MNKRWCRLLPFFLSGVLGALPPAINLEKAYQDGNFFQIMDFFQAQDIEKLPLAEWRLYVECLARTGHGLKAAAEVSRLLQEKPVAADTLATVAWVCLALGRWPEALRYGDEALAVDATCPRALAAKTMCLLFLRHFGAAQREYGRLRGGREAVAGCYQYFLIGQEIGRALADGGMLAELNKEYANHIKKSDRASYENLRLMVSMWKKQSGQLWFAVADKPERIILPLSRASGDSNYYTTNIAFAGRLFSTLIDTGNSLGWMIHDHTLDKLLSSSKGGIFIFNIGIDALRLTGNRLFTPLLDLSGCLVHNLPGLYVPKPRSDFSDANLNPFFFRDRVVTLDFLHDCLLLSTPAAYTSELAGKDPTDYVVLPAFGYDRLLVPVLVEGKTVGLALIETGAGGITVNRDFADSLALARHSRRKYLADGRMLEYAATEVSLSWGTWAGERFSAEIWPLEKMRHPLTGLVPDVVLGPKALAGKYSLTLDPFLQRVIICRREY